MSSCSSAIHLSIQTAVTVTCTAKQCIGASSPLTPSSSDPQLVNKLYFLTDGWLFAGLSAVSKEGLEWCCDHTSSLPVDVKGSS